MKYRVTIERIEDPALTPEVVYTQTADAEAFDLAGLIRVVNTRKRGPRTARAKKGDVA